jgi:energy-coupling factor transport system permease protein
MMFSFHDGPGSSPLARRNPIVKLVVFIGLTFTPIYFLDPATPLAFLLLAWAMAWPLARIAPWAMIWWLRPYLLLAFGLALFNSLFYGGATEEVWYTAGPLQLSREGVSFGAAIGLRLLCMITYTALFFATTAPAPFVNSLILQARLPYRLGFTILAAYRFLPILQQEMAQIRAAQHIRRGQHRAYFDPLTMLRHLSIPLLAGGIRRAERLALAMDGRGFGAYSARSYYVQPRVTRGDYIFLVAAGVVIAAMLAILAHWGLLRGGLIGVAEQLVGGRP